MKCADDTSNGRLLSPGLAESSHFRVKRNAVSGMLLADLIAQNEAVPVTRRLLRCQMPGARSHHLDANAVKSILKRWDVASTVARCIGICDIRCDRGDASRKPARTLVPDPKDSHILHRRAPLDSLLKLVLPAYLRLAPMPTEPQSSPSRAR